LADEIADEVQRSRLIRITKIRMDEKAGWFVDNDEVRIGVEETDHRNLIFVVGSRHRCTTAGK